jgi:hypothetical protein
VIAISDLSNSASSHHCHQSIGGRGSKDSVSVSAALASAAMAEWFRLTEPRRLNMNANELNEVTGGSIWLLPFAVACLGVGLLIGDALGARTITMGELLERHGY